MTKKQFLRAVVFLLLFALLFVPVNRLFSRPSQDYNYQMIRGFYEEPENSLDAVYVGSSNCFTFYNPLLGWKEWGIAVYDYACDAFPFEATSHIITEVRRTQPNALIIVNLNTLHDSNINMAMTHYLVDNIPMSPNRISLTQHLAEAAGWSFSDTLEFHFPILRFHSRWSELEMSDFVFSPGKLKGAFTGGIYLGTSQDISGSYRTSPETAVPNDWMLGCVDQLLGYCDENSVNILFVTVPRAESGTEVVSQLNYLEDYITDRGYPVLNLIDQTDAMGLDLTRDYYNNGHANIHGSLKYTRFLSRYLIENYGFTDKRGQEAYESWDKAVEKYHRHIDPYVLDFEFDPDSMTDGLAAPGNLRCQVSGDTAVLSWDASPGAQGYRVYRRTGRESWTLAADVTEVFFSESIDLSQSCRYRVVPWRTGESGRRLYGSFSYSGVDALP